MSLPIEDYALIGDCHTAALVGRNGSIDWLCLPGFDSPACFAALLGNASHGRWLIAPPGEVTAVRRRYREGTLILETEFETSEGAVRVIDCMAMTDRRRNNERARNVVRIVEGLSGKVPMCMELVIRFDYGSIIPWVRHRDGVLVATAGPDTLELHTDVEAHGENMRSVAEFSVREGERLAFSLNYRQSHEDTQPVIDSEWALRATERTWLEWSGRCTYEGPWREQVMRSLITLKALTYAPTGGIVAAPTTSLPEQWGGVRNWDYRFCWLRDSTFTLNAMLMAGYQDEAAEWRQWLLRTVAGNPENLQILYSITGRRRLDEREVDWLPGYGNARPVRIGNAASTQFQLDVYGEVMDTLHLARRAGLPHESAAWEIQVVLLRFLEMHWQDPDEGIWEVRGPRRHFTHSKVMAWVAFDRAIKDAQDYGLEGPVERWRETRDTIHAQVCDRGYDAERNTFVQSYGSPHLDASVLLIPLVGFLPADDPRVSGTVKAIEQGLMQDGLVLRYATETDVDALPPGEGTFLPCSFWFADCLVLTGRRQEGKALFERLLGLANDLGLLAEEYDTKRGHQLGNFPQALTHMALINTARLLSIPEQQAIHATETGERPAFVELDS